MSLPSPNLTPTDPAQDEHVLHAQGYAKLAVQVVIALTLTFAMVWLEIHQMVIPDWLTGAWGLIVGYFFGANGAARVVPALARMLKKALS